MNPMSLAEIAALCGGAPPLYGGERIISRVCKDTRALAPGDLYLALQGERFDGNAFAAEAAHRGAAGAILDQPPAGLPEGFPVIRVEEGLAALWRLAEACRERLTLKTVCVTGSNGKTSTKDFVAAVLGIRFRVTKTTGNLNNHIGLPLSILAADDSHGAAVWEIGMNHPGEIAPLARLAQPDIGIITNVGIAHIGNLGSREAIAEEKGRLFEALDSEATALLQEGEDFADFLASRTRATVLRVGGAASEVRADNARISPEGMRFDLVAGGAVLPAEIPALGMHMVTNALLAVAAGLAFGLSPEECAEGLSQAQFSGGRLTRTRARGVTFLDDTYNANPDSMIAALHVLRDMPCQGRRIAVLGRMGELGSFDGEGYRRVGAVGGADILISVGAETAPLREAARGVIPEVFAAEDNQEAIERLRELAHEDDLILVKGSRSAAMETIIRNF